MRRVLLPSPWRADPLTGPARTCPGRDDALYADEATYRAAIADCAAEGISLEMTHITIPESITLGIIDERDADIAQICRCIEAAGKAGLRGLNYNFLVGAAYARTDEHEETTGRGGSSYSQFGR